MIHIASDSPTPRLVDKEPVTVYTSVAVLISVALAAFGIVVDPGLLVTAIVAVLAVASPIVAAIKARAKVVPVQK